MELAHNATENIFCLALHLMDKRSAQNARECRIILFALVAMKKTN